MRLNAVMLLAVLIGPSRLVAQWVPQVSGTSVELRGLSVRSPSVAWASGQRGTVLRTTDGGSHWSIRVVPGAELLDLRAIEATSATTAFAMSIGDSSRIFRTTDGGVSWSLQLILTQKGTFLDAIRFWDAQHGIAMSDPVGGHFYLVATNDGGTTWREIPTDRMPPALANEGAFAASGSCLTVAGTSDVWFVTGGATTARVFHSSDRGQSWTVSDSPLRAGGAPRGIFSIAFRDARNGVIAGGDYEKPTLGGRNLAITRDAGATWTLGDSLASPKGFRSGVAFVAGADGRRLFAVGTSGIDRSDDGGESWQSMEGTGYNAVQTARGVAFVVGPKGRVAKLRTTRRQPP
ncbi:MAG: glycosyl hydrolase [Gemmatimonadota bacterium]|nr:glycosyl hydrolase [Gemmatimonadota bacterium]